MSIKSEARKEAFKRYDGDIDLETGEGFDDWGYSDCQREAFAAGAVWAESIVRTKALYDARNVVDSVLDDHGSLYPLIIGPITKLIEEEK